MFRFNDLAVSLRGAGSIQNRERLLWLINLRWWAMAATVIAVFVALTNGWDFVSPPALALGVVFGVLFNGVLYWRVRNEMQITEEFALHAIADIFALTWLLAFAGGLSNPLSVAYAFHVVIGALLAQQRGATAAFMSSLAGMLLLWMLEYHAILPVRPLEQIPVSLWWVSLLLLIGGVGYFSLVIARQLNEEHQQAVSASKRASSNLELLLSVLDNQDVGMEMISEEGKAVFANSLGREISSQVRRADDDKWVCPCRKEECSVGPRSLQNNDSSAPHNQCRFQLTLGEKSKFYEMIYVEAKTKVPYDLALYVDRTDILVFEQKNMQLDQLVTLGRTLQSFAHELNTPLMTLTTINEDVAHVLKQSDLKQDIQNDVLESLILADSELNRCQRLTHSLLGVAELTHGKPLVYWNMGNLIARVIQLVKVGHRNAHIQFDWSESDFSALSLKNADLVFQIMLNLLRNAVYALEHSGEKDPKIEIGLKNAGKHYEIFVKDNGPGLSYQVREHLFQPFITSKPPGEGTGLGLYASLLMAQKLGGNLEISNNTGQGVLACLKLSEAYIKNELGE